ncbi:Hypothetical predicted protein [Mytilus galloprovincialis]|uniref:Uncharacterized protein n=1 Tax=Mytilus galloprovincialis TaxID=29158 RepID=A0A8B6FPB1_MYTGA|nr:Hypothetical predicted protein [Mytilus galloprovincialis]
MGGAKDRCTYNVGNEESAFKAKSRKCCVWICQITSEAFLEEEDLLHYIGRIESTVSKSAIGAVLLILSYALSIMSLAIAARDASLLDPASVMETDVDLARDVVLINVFTDIANSERLAGFGHDEMDDYLNSMFLNYTMNIF